MTTDMQQESEEDRAFRIMVWVLVVFAFAFLFAASALLWKAWQKFDADIRTAAANERIAVALEVGVGLRHYADVKPIPAPDPQPCGDQLAVYR